MNLVFSVGIESVDIESVDIESVDIESVDIEMDTDFFVNIIADRGAESALSGVEISTKATLRHRISPHVDTIMIYVQNCQRKC